MTQTTRSYISGTGEFQEQVADLSGIAGQTRMFQKGSVLALHYHALRTYYDFHESNFRNEDVVLPPLVEELRGLQEKGYMALAPAYIQMAVDDLIYYRANGDSVHDPLSDADIEIPRALEGLMDYVGLMSAPMMAANDPLPELKAA